MRSFTSLAWTSMLLIGAIPVAISLCISPVRKVLVVSKLKKICFIARNAGCTVANAAKDAFFLISSRGMRMSGLDENEAPLLQAALDSVFEQYPDVLGNDHFNNSLCAVLSEHQMQSPEKISRDEKDIATLCDVRMPSHPHLIRDSPLIICMRAERRLGMDRAPSCSTAAAAVLGCARPCSASH